jgi:hypothetical protein
MVIYNNQVFDFLITMIIYSNLVFDLFDNHGYQPMSSGSHFFMKIVGSSSQDHLKNLSSSQKKIQVYKTI